MKEQFETQAYSPTIESSVDDISKPYHYLLMSILDGQSPQTSKIQAYENMVMREAIHQVGEEKAKMILEYCQQMEADEKASLSESTEMGTNTLG
jgi:hypothetical protein